MPRAQVYADILRRLLRTGARPRAEKLVARMHAADIADVLGRVPVAARRPLVDILGARGKLVEVLRELPEERLTDVLALLDDARLADVLARSAPDDAVA